MSSKNILKIPHHLAVIPDGNRRWSKMANVSLTEGYAKGAENFMTIAEAAFVSGVKYFTIWGASEDNLKKRSQMEINILIMLFRKELRKIIDSGKLEKHRIRMKIVGNGIRTMRDAEVKRLAEEIERKTERFSAKHLTLLLGYDGKTEMLSAIKCMRDEKNAPITYEGVKRHLITGFLPPVDFLIRTGGEPHWSAGFMMWLVADSELYFPEMYWPAFHPKDLKDAFVEFSHRRSMKGK